MAEPFTKKRKQSQNDAEVSTKKSKKEKHEKDSKAKGKARETEFHVVKTSLALSIPPIFASNPRAGAEEMLDSMVMRYIPALRGVVLSHSNLRFLSNAANIHRECPFLVCKVEFDATIWSPRLGMKLVGKINLCSPDHISLLVHRTFNVSIPRHHIPREQWIFEYGPAENDPEFGPEANQENKDDEAKPENGGGGKWVHHLTSMELGGPHGYLEFTVIGLTIANEMLSLIGSIQHDPFSPDHVTRTEKRDQEDMDAAETKPQEATDSDEEEDEDEMDSDDDGFEALTNKKKEAAASATREAEEATLAEKEKKRKRKVEKAEEKRQKRPKT